MENTSIEVFAKSGHWKWKIINAVDIIPEADLSKENIESVLRELKVNAEVLVHTFEDIGHTQYQINQKLDLCLKCKTGVMLFNKACGVEVCSSCNQHKGLAKCYCGWNVRDDVDRVEVGMNEDAKYLGDGEWEVNY